MLRLLEDGPEWACQLSPFVAGKALYHLVRYSRSEEAIDHAQKLPKGGERVSAKFLEDGIRRGNALDKQPFDAVTLLVLSHLDPNGHAGLFIKKMMEMNLRDEVRQAAIRAASQVSQDKLGGYKDELFERAKASVEKFDLVKTPSEKGRWKKTALACLCTLAELEWTTREELASEIAALGHSDWDKELWRKLLEPPRISVLSELSTTARTHVAFEIAVEQTEAEGGEDALWVCAVTSSKNESIDDFTLRVRALPWLLPV